MALPGGDDVVLGLVLLEHQPHGLDVVAGEAPVALGVEVAQVELVLEAELDAGGGPGDLAGDEGLAAPGRLVVEEDAVAGVEPVGLPVVDRLPEGVHLGDSVGAAGVERGGLGLRHLDGLAVHLAGGGLVVADRVVEVAHRLQQPQRPQRHHVGRVDGALEGDRHVGLGAQVVHLAGLDLAEDVAQRVAVGEVGVVEEQLHPLLVGVEVEVVDALGGEGGGAANQAVHLVALAEQELRQVGAVLAGDAGDERSLGHRRGHLAMGEPRLR